MTGSALLIAIMTLSVRLADAPVAEAGICSPYLDALRQRSPVVEARENVGRGDRHFVGVRGVMILVPGVPIKPAARLVPKYGVRVIEHTSDAIADDSCANYQGAAVDFAAAYNKEMLALTRVR